MQEKNQTNTINIKKNSSIDFHSVLNLRHIIITEKEEKHFTKAINGAPGLNPPSNTFYPRSYSADGPGGNYPGL